MAENFAYDLIEEFDNPSDAEKMIKMMYNDVVRNILYGYDD